MRPPHSRPASGGSLTNGGATSGSDSLACLCQRTVAPSRPDLVWHRTAVIVVADLLPVGVQARGRPTGPPPGGHHDGSTNPPDGDGGAGSKGEDLPGRPNRRC